jgi:hypothetical protein
MASGGAFHCAFPHASQQAFLEAHERAFFYFGGVFAVLRYDNLKSAVKKILRGHQREETTRFIAAEIKPQAWHEQCKQAIKKNESEPAQPDVCLSPPSQKRLLLMDATTESSTRFLTKILPACSWSGTSLQVGSVNWTSRAARVNAHFISRLGMVTVDSR